MDWDRIGPPLDVRPLFPVERALLLDVVSALSPQQWTAPTACRGWAVRDVVAHLAHDYLRRLSRHRDGHGGIPVAPGEELPGYLNRTNGDFVRVAADLSPRVLVDVLAWFGPQLDDLWTRVPMDRIGESAVWWAAPGTPAPVWLDVAREYTEFWVHQQHIRDAVGRPGGCGVQLMGPVIDTFVRALPHVLRDVPADEGNGIALAVRPPVDVRWYLTRDAAGWSLAPVTRFPDDAATRLELSPEVLWRLATGAVGPDVARRNLRVSGDEKLADAVLDIVAVIR